MSTAATAIRLPGRARNTLDLNYLARAETMGAEVRPLHVVRTIVPEDGRYRLYERIENSSSSPDPSSPTASLSPPDRLGRRIAPALSRSIRTLPNIGSRLGHRWSANGDFLTVSLPAGA